MISWTKIEVTDWVRSDYKLIRFGRAPFRTAARDWKGREGKVWTCLVVFVAGEAPSEGVANSGAAACPVVTARKRTKATRVNPTCAGRVS
jgi:hypothetical protein